MIGSCRREVHWRTRPGAKADRERAIGSTILRYIISDPGKKAFSLSDP
jgi:hypothetical protein